MTRIYDEEKLKQAVKKAINENAYLILEYKKGNIEVFNVLMRESMKHAGGRGDPSTIRRLLMERLVL